MIDATYLLPLRATSLEGLGELTDYLKSLSVAEKIVVDGSSPEIFAAHAQAWRDVVTHLAPEPIAGANGKVAGVLTGLRAARCDRIIVADDDVRYARDDLVRVAALLSNFDVVRPQNYFDPMPWHAVLDTSRTLLNRASGGDWPGTLAFRRSALSGGYRSDVLFENLELVRTVRARGGTECVAMDLYVRRLPPSAAKYISQRVRQAYDEWARPARLALALATVPFALFCLTKRYWWTLAASACFTIGLAEIGRRKSGGAKVFPLLPSLLAPLWLSERGLCAWIAVVLRMRGGVRYGSVVLRDAATPQRRLERSI